MGIETLPKDPHVWVQSKILVSPTTNCWFFRYVGSNPPRARIPPNYQKKYNLISNMASRAIFALYRPDEFNEDLCVLHTSECPAETAYKCVNPDHLYLGSVQNNAIDRTNFGLQPKGEDVVRSIFTEKEVRKIRKWYQEGLTPIEIFRKMPFFVERSIDQVSYTRGYNRILDVLRRTWRHLR